tara:strand:- start:1289 stop:1567 length:279 start_codon:yes stop_codon:yes gene_type:complete
MNRIRKVLEHIENDTIDLENIDDVSIVQIYSNIIYEKINNCTIHWLKEFYQESGNWLMNWNIDKKRDTILWNDMNDIDKKKLLDKEIENHFN